MRHTVVWDMNNSCNLRCLDFVGHFHQILITSTISIDNFFRTNHTCLFSDVVCESKVSQSFQNGLMASELDVLGGISQECFLFFAKISPDLNHGFSFVLMPEWEYFSLPFITIFRNNYPHEDLLYFGEEFHALTRKYQQVTSWHSHILRGNCLINSEFITLIENARKSTQEFKCL